MSEKKTKCLNIYQRINAVMKEVECLQKGEKAAKGLPYKFVSHDQVTGALHGPMTNHGIVMTSDIVELNQNGNRTEVKLAITFINIDNPDDRFTSHFWGYGIDNQDKGLGKAISYAVKYCLLKTFCLETCDDVEKDNIDHVPDVCVSDSDIQNLEILINGHDDIREKVLSRCNGDFKNITKKQYPLILAWVNKEVR